MSVMYVNGGNGLLGTLGTLATLGGSFIPGASWLSSLGMGMNMANSMMNGQGMNGQGQSAMEQILSGLAGKMFQNPASGSMINQTPYEELLQRGWGRNS